jgi:alpha-tubulin suppressor-like RCC1 family protein
LQYFGSGPETRAIMGIHFINEKIGWAVGYNYTILKTEDGGLTWNDVSGTGINIQNLEFVRFADELHGWIGGRSGTIYYTQNGGATWDSKTLPDSPVCVFDIDFADSDNGILAAGRGRVYSTTNATVNGGNWTSYSYPGAGVAEVEVKSVHFRDPLIGWAVAYRANSNWTGFVESYIFRYKWDSNTGTYVWSHQTIANVGFEGVSFSNIDEGWIIGATGAWTGNKAYRTTNGSTDNTWTVVDLNSVGLGVSDSDFNFYKCYAPPNTNTVFYFGLRSIKSIDNGANWTSISGVHNNLNGIHFVNETHGWAVGDNGTIIRTTDGGNTWVKQTPPVGLTGTTFNSVHFINDSGSYKGWAVGNGGKIIYTANGGTTWTEQVQSATSANLTGVSFPTTSYGIAVETSTSTANLYFIFTNDGGVNWTRNGTNFWTQVYNAVMINDTTGYAVGWTEDTNNRGYIYKITRGTPWNWERYNMPQANNNDYRNKYLRGIGFYGTNICVAGDSGFVAYSTNSGTNWSWTTISGSPNIKGVSFSSASTVWAVGDGGKIYRSTNGGATWTESNSGTTNDLRAVSFSSPSNRGWTAGALGTIKHYSKKLGQISQARITSGHEHSLAIKSYKNTSSVWAWGRNTNGQLGIGSTASPQTSPVQVVKGESGGDDPTYISDVIAVAAGQYHSVALKSDGTVWTWGLNTNGQLGDASTNQRTSPVQVKGPGGTGTLSDIKAISCGDTFTVAVKNDGTVYAWGLNNVGQLGYGSYNATSGHADYQKTSPIQVLNLTGIDSVSSGREHTLALKNDGTVWAWGEGRNSGRLGDGFELIRATPVQVVGSGGIGTQLTGITAIVAGGYQSHALKANDGTVWSWGVNGQGQLGNGTLVKSIIPVQVKISSSPDVFLTGVTALGAGDVNTYAIKSGTPNTLWAWGYRTQVGDSNTTTDRPFAVQVAGGAAGGTYLTDVAAVSSKWYHTHAMLNNGSLVAWGWNDNGRFGNGAVSTSAHPSPVMCLFNFKYD